MQDTISVSFLGKEKIAKDTWRFLFQKDANFMYQAGQYVSVFLGEDTRDFTIASSPLEKDKFFLVTKNGKSAFKKNLFALSAGSKVAMKSPTGGFILREENTTPLVFLSGGIGITAFHSMITYAHAKGLTFPITLIASFSKREYMIFQEELEKIDAENPLIKIIYTLSQDNWESEKGRISDAHIKKYVRDMHNKIYMITGGEKMVENTEELLLSMGIDSSKIRIDIFTGY
ncbi:MAG TPA: FAD-dependent oxidoreductase [Candidatus Eisenbacteria bacterium]|nr:FAD-dependent oxidoreductase [Candidatus Eisenbacteria bacterium]